MLHKIRTFALAAVCAAGLPGALRAQSLDITHYDLSIRTDYAAKRIAIRTRIEILNPQMQDSLTLLLDSNYEIQAARANGTAVTPRWLGGALTVALPKAEKVTLEFETARANGLSASEPRSVMGDQDLFLIWSDRFFPADFDDWATVTTTITVPGGFSAIAPGKLVRAEEGSATSTFEYATTNPVSGVSVFADKRWVRGQRMVSGTRIQTLLHPSVSGQSEKIITSSADVLRFYKSLNGSYPYDGFAFITIDSIYARRAFPGFVAYEPAYLERELATTGYDAHETALLWWFWAMRGRGPGAWQWTEGFGDYLEVLYAEARKKPLPQIMEQFREQYLATAAADEPRFPEYGSGLEMQKYIHGRLPWLLHVLRYTIGDGDFRKGLELVYERHRFATFTIDELIKAFEDAAKEPLGWWRDEWLYRPGVPDLDVVYRVNPSAEGPLTVVTVRQRGPVYYMPLDLQIDGKIERVQLTDRVSTFSFRTSRAPNDLTVDPKRWLLLKATVTPSR